jgi:hypothetical protein
MPERNTDITPGIIKGVTTRPAVSKSGKITKGYVTKLIEIFEEQTMTNKTSIPPEAVRALVPGETLHERYWRIVCQVVSARKYLEPGATGCAWTCNVTQRAAIWHCNRGEDPRRIPASRALGRYTAGWGILDGLEAWLVPVRAQDLPARLARGECLIFWQRAGKDGRGLDHVWCGRLPPGGLAGGATITLDVAEGGQSTLDRHGHVTQRTLKLGPHGLWMVVPAGSAGGPEGGSTAVVQGIYCLDDLDLQDEEDEAMALVAPPLVVPPLAPVPEPSKAPSAPLAAGGVALGVGVTGIVSGGAHWWIYGIAALVCLISIAAYLLWIRYRSNPAKE